jgi:hypothetical protein
MRLFRRLRDVIRLARLVLENLSDLKDKIEEWKRSKP